MYNAGSGSCKKIADIRLGRHIRCLQHWMKYQKTNT